MHLSHFKVVRDHDLKSIFSPVQHVDHDALGDLFVGIRDFGQKDAFGLECSCVPEHLVVQRHDETKRTLQIRSTCSIGNPFELSQVRIRIHFPGANMCAG